MPIFIFVKEQKSPSTLKAFKVVFSGFRQFYGTFCEIRKLKGVLLFLLGYWRYIDGVDTIIIMAVDYGMSIGLSSTSLIVALLITQFVGFPAALAFGKVGEKLGAKTGIIIGIGVYAAVTIWGYFLQREGEFYLLAVIIGLVQGGVQSLSRSFYARIVPKNKAAQFFGFYNMLGKFAAVLGPFSIGWVSLLTGSPRYSILSLLLLFIPGAIILSCVDEKAGKQKARELESANNAR
jgi:UMF1 family MFS transporter